MKNLKSIICFLLYLIVFAIMFTGCSPDSLSGNDENIENQEGDKIENMIPEEIIAFPAKTDEPVINHGKGWILYGDTSNQTKETLALASTGYARFSWAGLNPSEGVYNWEIIDNAIEDWKYFGKQFAFGIMSVNTFGNSKEIPEWVFEKGLEYTMGKDEATDELKYFIPVWNDPVYIEECAKFAKALAERYDGNPDIAFIDIRNYGNWGEKHLYPFEKTSKYISEEDLKKLYQPYIDYFKETRLVICCNDNEPQYDNLNKWAVDNGVTYRRDGLMGRLGWGGSNGDELNYAFDKLPLIWEFFGTFRSLENAEGRKWNDGEFMENIKNNQPTYIGMGQWGDDAEYMLSQKEDLIKQAANMMGYHFTVVQAEYTNVITSGQENSISVQIENSGVAKMFTECKIKLALLDKNDVAAAEFLTDWNPNGFSAGSVAVLNATNVKFDAGKGSYRLAIGFFDSANNSPAYKIGNAVKTKDNWYILGDIHVR